MQRSLVRGVPVAVATALLLLVCSSGVAAQAAQPQSRQPASFSVGPITDTSSACMKQNAEVEDVSTQYGDPSIWPGDTFGIATLSPTRIALSWGSATPTTPGTSEIYGSVVNARLP
jgi:hypothetical protein